MTVSEKKIELVQALLLLQDKATLFEIEKLIAAAFNAQKNSGSGATAIEAGKTPATFEAWAAQFEAPEYPDTADDYGMTPIELRQRIWAAENGQDMSLEEFFERIAQN
jgi:hypothetical protein